MAIRFFDMFAGIGGFRSGLEAVGGFECIGHCEIDKKANTAYLRLTPEDGKVLLDGKPARISSGVPGFACGVDADILLDMQICTCAQERSDENRFFIMAEPPMEESEDFGMTM